MRSVLSKLIWWRNIGADRRYRRATPYHAPLYLAQKLGYFADEDIKVAILEPTDPSGK